MSNNTYKNSALNAQLVTNTSWQGIFATAYKNKNPRHSELDSESYNNIFKNFKTKNTLRIISDFDKNYSAYYW